ncbi:Flp family type IVb pilin [Candidatus Riflebacteria bacterium]
MVNLIWGEDGQALVEYTLIIGLIAVICIPALTKLGESIARVFGLVNEALEDTSGY